MPQNEIELKFLEVNREEMEKKILALGGKKIFDDVLDHTGLGPKPKGVVGFRLRSEGDVAKLTVKCGKEGEVGGFQNVLEHEISVSDHAEALSLFEALGYHVRTRRQKHRTSYKVENIRIEFDKLLGEFDFVPEFMELEATSEASLLEFLPRLGLRQEDSVPWSNRLLIAHYQNLQK